MTAMDHIITTSLPYTNSTLVDKVGKLSIVHNTNNNVVTTLYDNSVIREKEVSNRYFTFDFPQFVQGVLPAIEQYVNPSNYILNFKGGQQEIRLIGDEVNINGDVFFKMLSIVNSTDKSRSLQMNMGLLRLVCTNGMFKQVDDEAVSIRGKHFKSSLPEKIEKFTTGIERFSEITLNQLDGLASLIGKKVSYRQLINELIRDQKTRDILDWRMYYANRFANKLLSSQTDGILNPTELQKELLSNVQNIAYDRVVGDFDIDAYQVVNCWTEIFRNEDSSKIKRESHKIISLVETLS